MLVMVWGVLKGTSSMTDVGGGRRGLYSEIQCFMGNGRMGTPLPMWTYWLTDVQTRMKTILSHNCVGGRQISQNVIYLVDQ